MEAKIVPVEYKVLVKLDPVKEREGLIYKPDVTKEREQYAQVAATIAAKGGMAFDDWKGQSPQVGDRVLVAKYAGLPIPGYDPLLRLCNDKDIAAIIEAEND